MKPKSYVPGCWYFRATAKSCWGRLALTVSNQVCWDLGVTVLILLNAKPTSPSFSASWLNWAETDVAAISGQYMHSAMNDIWRVYLQQLEQ